MRRILCWLLGHQWRTLRSIDRVFIYMPLHPLIGMDADCERCGKEWRDYENFNRYPWTDR